MRRKYPEARRAAQEDVLHGAIVKDPYRWLEDLTSGETREWVREQGALSRSFLDALPLRLAILERCTRLFGFPEQGLPQTGGGRAFVVESDGTRQRPALCWRTLPELADPHVLIDQERLEGGPRGVRRLVRAESVRCSRGLRGLRGWLGLAHDPRPRGRDGEGPRRSNPAHALPGARVAAG